MALGLSVTTSYSAFHSQDSSPGPTPEERKQEAKFVRKEQRRETYAKSQGKSFARHDSGKHRATFSSDHHAAVYTKNDEYLVKETQRLKAQVDRKEKGFGLATGLTATKVVGSAFVTGAAPHVSLVGGALLGARKLSHIQDKQLVHSHEQEIQYRSRNGGERAERLKVRGPTPAQIRSGEYKELRNQMGMNAGEAVLKHSDAEDKLANFWHTFDN